VAGTPVAGKVMVHRAQISRDSGLGGMDGLIGMDDCL